MDKLDNNKLDEIDILIGNGEKSDQSKDPSDVPNDEKYAELLDSLQRLQADFNNYRRHSEKEKEELAEYVRGNVFQELLPILDDYERLLTSESNNIEIKKGALLIYKNLMSVLSNLGLKGFLDKGKEFDPNYHEGISVKPVDAEHDGKIIETWQKGYRLNDRLLRPAKVVVGEFKPE